jgi:hypothetical protein
MLGLLGWLYALETLAPSTGAGIVTAVATLITALAALLGGLAVIIPALRRSQKLQQELHRNITQNGHRDRRHPTLPDRIEDLSRDVKALARVLDQHLEWSDRWSDLMERELTAARNSRKEQHDEDSAT